jgi:hypothetical protein
MEPKKYNNVLTLAFSIDHVLEDGTDITPEMVQQALRKRVSGLTASGMWDEVGCIEDTIDIN